MRRASALFMIPALFLLGACAKQISPNTYTNQHVGEASETFAGTIASVRQVMVQGSDELRDNNTGVLAGGVLGGIGGSTLGKGKGNYAMTALGAVAGAAAGAYAEQELSKQNALEYIVQLDNGQLLTVVQGLEPSFTPGQRVFVIKGQRGRSRIIPNYAPPAP